jgi:transposase
MRIMEVRSRRFRSKQEKREIVEETLKPGGSVSQVARKHDVNANQVFYWRRQYLAGRLDTDAVPPSLLPVKISDQPAVPMKAAKTSRQAPALTTGRIEIDLGHAQVRIEGSADPACVRAALEGLAR